MNPLFSLVIPIYNSEKYLFECVNSIIKQQFNNLEMILIDDYSTDQSIKIANSFLKKNKNIKIIRNKKNEGVSVCRNKGIKIAKGKYIIFVDSDDFLLRDSLKKLADFIKKHNDTNIIIFTSYFRKAESKFFKNKMFTPSNSVLKKNNSILELYKNKPMFHTCWSYIFDRRFLLRNKLSFIRDVNIGEDVLLISKVFCCCKKFLFYKKALYCKRLGVGALANRIGYKTCVDLMKVINEMCLFVKKKRLINEKKEFMLEKIRKPLIEIIPRLILLNQNEIFKLSKIIKVNLKNFKIIEKISERKDLFFYLRKYGVFKGLINYKKFIVNEIKLLVEDFGYEKIYIFSKSFFGIAMAQVLLDYGYPIKGFFDNSKVLSKNSISNMKVFSPTILKNKSEGELSKFFFIISNQEKRDIKNIVTQLKKYEIKKKQIGNIYFNHFI